MIDFACKKFDLLEVIKCSLGLSKADLKVLKLFFDCRREKVNADEIARKLKLNLSTVQRAVKKLHSKNMIKRMQVNLGSGGYVFFYKLHDKSTVRREILGIVHNWTKKVEDELMGL